MVSGLPVETLYAAYVFVFAAAALVCVVTGYRAREIAHEKTRRGLSWLLLTAGGWAAAHVGYLTAPTPQSQYVFYTIGVGIDRPVVVLLFGVHRPPYCRNSACAELKSAFRT